MRYVTIIMQGGMIANGISEPSTNGMARKNAHERSLLPRIAT